MRKNEFIFEGFDKRFGNFFVEKIRLFARQSTLLKIRKLLHKRFILGKMFFKDSRIKNKPLVDIGNE